MSHDASATWSGFNYQGKVALYHTLWLINEKLNLDVNFDFTGYELILENHEDFDIKGPNGFESFHQVKAINETAFSTYEDALFAMLVQLDCPQNLSVKGYLHTWKGLNWNGSNTFEEKLKAIFQKVITEHNDNQSKFHISQVFSDSSDVSKKIKIIRQASKYDARLDDETNIVNVLTNIKDSLSQDRVVSRVKQYAYGVSELACDINDIDEKVKAKITELHKLKTIVSVGNMDKWFCALLAKLDDNITAKHSNLTSNLTNPIPFVDIVEISTNTSLVDTDKAFMASRFKLLFIKSFEEFLNDPYLCNVGDCEAYFDKESNLNEPMEFLLNLSAPELFNQYIKLSPQLALDSNVSIDNAFVTNFDNLRQFLFSMFRDICRTKLTINKDERKLHYQNGDLNYLPTTISDQSPGRTVVEILKNVHAYDSLFEMNAMVSGNESILEIERFSDVYSKLTNLSTDELNSIGLDQGKEKVSHIRQDIRLIKLSTAMREMV